tara:strand:- start:568 stop:762 length:195 start_codon:yes stop_codon:yes gene_type:complete
MEKNRDFYTLKRELREIKDLLGEVLRRLGKMEYDGIVKYGTPNHVSDNKQKYIHLDLKRKSEDT